MSEAEMGLPGPALPKRSLAVVLKTVIAVALVSQAAAMKCYQAPKSWPACWTDPNGEYEPCTGLCVGLYARHILTEACSQAGKTGSFEGTRVFR
jgi:hypothetical protein